MLILPDEDISKEIIEGPGKVIEIMEKKDADKKEPFSYTKTLKTFLFDNAIKATIHSSDDPGATKISGNVEWIADRRDQEKGVEFFVRTRSEGKVVSIGLHNLKSATYNPQKRSFEIVQNPITCPVCNKPIQADQTTISCPNCHVQAHKEDFLEYLKLNGECPSCKAKLTMKGK